MILDNILFKTELLSTMGDEFNEYAAYIVRCLYRGTGVMDYSCLLDNIRIFYTYSFPHLRFALVFPKSSNVKYEGIINPLFCLVAIRDGKFGWIFSEDVEMYNELIGW